VRPASALWLHPHCKAVEADGKVPPRLLPRRHFVAFVVLSRRGPYKEAKMANNQRTTLVAAFRDRYEAEKAVDELEQAGFNGDEVGFAIRGSDVASGGMITDEEGAKDRPGALAGMATGAGVGALLGAAAALLVPGIG